MKILIIHLSDIHIANSTKHMVERAIKIIDAVKNLELVVSQVFILVSGDIVHSGKIKEYEIAVDFLDKLKDETKSKICPNIKFIVIPGNHDLEFDEENEDARNAIIETIRKNDFTISGKSMIDLCIRNQENFFNYCLDLYNENLINNHDNLFYQYYYNVDGYRILFNCLNTSWMSILKEDNQYAKMGFPIDHLGNQLEAEFTITIFHHPLNWFEGNNAKKIKSYIQEKSDMVLTGHEHDPMQTSSYSYKGKKYIEYIEGGILNNNSNISESSFNIIFLNTNEGTHKLLQFNFNEDIYIKEEITDGWISNHKSESTSKNRFLLNPQFIAWLNDPGATIYYQYSDNSLLLEDIFVYPELKNTLNDEQCIRLNDKFSSESIIKLNQYSNRIFLIGREAIGKTTLLKKLFYEFYNQGLLPVYIDGFNLRETTPDSFRSLVLKSIVNQYEKNDLNRIEQLDFDKFFIIIDNFHKTKLPPRYKARFISNNFIEGEDKKVYKNVILCGNDSMQFEELIYKDDDFQNPLNHFMCCEMLPFGFNMRYKLIEKWYSNGKEKLSDTQLISKIEYAERIINSNLGNNYIPSFPIFILVHLHKLDIERESELKTSSYGYYYEYLIITSISRIDNDLLDSYLTYLTHFAYYLFSNKYHEITYDEFKKFDIEIFRQRHRIPKDLDSIINLLKLAGVLEKSNDLFNFKHNYIYYYFLARYFRETISSNITREQISNLVKELYKDENASILIFLTHLSKDNFIVETLVKNAKEIFKEHPPLHINDDCTAIDDLIENLPKLIVDTRNIRQNREEYRERMDVGNNIPTGSNYNTDIEDEEENGEAKEMMDSLRKSFKTIQVLGQIGKNYHGSLTISQLFDVIEEAYLLGLRSANSFITFLEENTDAFVSCISDRIEEIIKIKEIEMEAKECDELAKKIAFGLCLGVIENVIKRVSFSVGSNKLIETYREIYEKYDWNSVKLIDIQLKLEHNNHFPIKDIITANKSINKKKISSMLLKIFVKFYLEMYPVDVGTMQKISSELNFDIDTMRLLLYKQKNKLGLKCT